MYLSHEAQLCICCAIATTRDPCRAYCICVDLVFFYCIEDQTSKRVLDVLLLYHGIAQTSKLSECMGTIWASRGVGGMANTVRSIFCDKCIRRGEQRLASLLTAIYLHLVRT